MTLQQQRRQAQLADTLEFDIENIKLVMVYGSTNRGAKENAKISLSRVVALARRAIEEGLDYRKEEN